MHKFVMFDMTEGCSAIVSSEKTVEELQELYEEHCQEKAAEYQQAASAYWEEVETHCPDWLDFELFKGELAALLARSDMMDHPPRRKTAKAFEEWLKDYVTIEYVEELSYV